MLLRFTNIAMKKLSNEGCRTTIIETTVSLIIDKTNSPNTELFVRLLSDFTASLKHLKQV